MNLLIFYHVVLIFTAISAGKIDPLLKEAVDNNVETEAIVEFPNIQNQISGLESMSGDAKMNHLVASLKALTSTTQAPVVTAADSLNLTTQQFWIANIVQVKGLTPEKLIDLASIEGDFIIRPQHKLSLPPMSQEPVANITNTVQWGVERIRAPEIWKYTKGEGIVVGIIDSGVNLGHISLTESFTGQWLDPHYSTEKPTDVLGHGTHVAGIILGRHGVGVAPNARWMACRVRRVHADVKPETEYCLKFVGYCWRDSVVRLTN
ncbi:bacillopeptidase F-like [Folsomia candida]|uniref:bacillopeptidase F-like n=1 Tax=Folsomia candida TaxID=158441 RepID=UPI000B901BD8|nr:bacillopeptidase F-like [Folsomia candida]